MDKDSARRATLPHLLSEVAFEGWGQRALEAAAARAGLQAADIIRLFPNGSADAVDFFCRASDDAMLAGFHALTPSPVKIREKIEALVWARLEFYAKHKEAVRRTCAYFSLPMHLPAGLKALHRTVDAMWIAAGDASHDMNWYSKRALLAGVYSSTLLFFLNDESEGHAESRAFLQRRIANVMKIEEWKRKLFH